MRLLVAATALVVTSCNSSPSQSGNVAGGDNPTSEASMAASRASVTQMSLLNTSWEFDDGGKPTVITIDAAGAYIENRADGTHVDHGAYLQKDGKDCFTSAMGDEGTSCWTAVPEVAIGATASATSDSGQIAVFKRVQYRELTIGG